MKTTLLILVLLGSGSFASAKCLGEAQISAKITSRSTNSLTYCKAHLDPKQISHYSMSGVCPLSIDDVLAEGISFPLQNGHDCEIPSSIEGYIVLGADGKIWLE